MTTPLRPPRSQEFRPAGRPRRWIAVLVSALVGSGAAALPVLTPPAAGAQAEPGCPAPLVDRPMPAQRLVNRHSAALPEAARRSGRSQAEFQAMAEDRSLWVDTCGQGFFVEEKTPVAIQGVTATSTDTPATSAAVADAFSLESRPGAPRTIFLDFDGGTVSGTAWNNAYTAGLPIVVSPYTSDADPTTFTTTELAQITKAWQVVAADYAAFDVNVTTKDPGQAAIDRTDAADLEYGSHVLVSDDNAIYAGCGCGGVAYVGVFNAMGSNHLYYQPAWVFLSGVGTSGKNIGEAAAHEVGHNFGLHHDGTSSASYYSGSRPWAPIMGASYYQPVSQWSAGEYPGATNQEDDLAVIATGAPLVADDHGDSAATATALGAAPVDGLIATRTDVDAFSFDAAGTTTLTVAVQSYMTDLDVSLTIQDAGGAVIATVDPTVAYVSSSSATGLDATWSVSLPAAGGSYTAFVDGVGAGDPAVAGGYSDYASLGGYTVTLSTQAPALAAMGETLPDAERGTAYDSATVTVSGGAAPYTFSGTGLPSGMSIDPGTGHLTGTPTEAGDFSVQVTVIDADGASATVTDPLHVVDGALPPVAAADEVVRFVVGRLASATLSASGGDGTYTWTASGPLPDGLTLNPDGTLTGTPTSPGGFTFSVTATSAGMSDASTVTVTVDPVLGFVTGNRLPGARKGRAYRTVIRTDGGVPEFTWTKVGGSLPRGLRLRYRGDRVVIVGTPHRAGRFHVRLRVTGGHGQQAAQTFRLRVRR